MLTKIAAIRIGERHRKDLGDLQSLADSIRQRGLLQPIGITATRDLVFGERRLAACRAHLGWTEIETRIIDIASIAEGEHDENELRKNFTRSERLAILQTLERKKRGGDQSHSLNLANAESAAKSAGFANRQEAAKVGYIDRRGLPEIAAAVDQNMLSLNAGYHVARLPKEQQSRALHEKLETKRHAQKRKKQLSQSQRTITLPWSAKTAARLLLERWPRDLVLALADEIQRRVGDPVAAAATGRVA